MQQLTQNKVEEKEATCLHFHFRTVFLRQRPCLQFWDTFTLSFTGMPATLQRGEKMRLATRTDAIWTANTLKLVTGTASFWFHNQWQDKHWWCPCHIRASAFMRADSKGTLSRVGAYQQRKPSLMITGVQALNLIETWCSILNATKVQTKCNQNKMTWKETTRTMRETGHHSSNRGSRKSVKTRTSPHKNRWRKH